MSQLSLLGAPDAALFSPCGEFRYLLTRELGGTRTVVFVLLNPSTATAEKPDPTLTRCIEFARAWGFGRLVILILNLCAYRATKPKKMFARLAAGLDVVGPDNDATIEAQMRTAEMVVLGWGANAGKRALRERTRHVLALLRRTARSPVMVLRHTKSKTSPTRSTATRRANWPPSASSGPRTHAVTRRRRCSCSSPG